MATHAEPGECLNRAAELLAPWTRETNSPESNRLDVFIDANDVVAAAQALTAGQWGYLAAMTGLDLGTEAGLLAILYQFCCGGDVVTLRVQVPRERPVVPSVYGVIPSVSFYERELIEMFGFVIEGTPNTDRLFLPDDWPDGVYPLRKDFSIEDAQA